MFSPHLVLIDSQFIADNLSDVLKTALSDSRIQSYLGNNHIIKQHVLKPQKTGVLSPSKSSAWTMHEKISTKAACHVRKSLQFVHEAGKFSRLERQTKLVQSIVGTVPVPRDIGEEFTMTILISETNSRSTYVKMVK